MDYLWPIVPKVSLRDRRLSIRRITQCQLVARLFQRRADLAKIGGKLGSDALNGGDDRECDTRGDQAIFDGGGAGFISPKSANCFHAIGVGPIVKALLNPIAETQGYLLNFRR